MTVRSNTFTTIAELEAIYGTPVEAPTVKEVDWTMSHFVEPALLESFAVEDKHRARWR